MNTDPKDEIAAENRDYWTHRSQGYSDINKQQLLTSEHRRWAQVLSDTIKKHYPHRKPEELYILDVGTGPGFFSILLTEMGYRVTAVDLTEAMLEEARSNAGHLRDQIRFMQMNAEELDFPDHCFDVLVSRNLTWNLPHPKAAYHEWNRVLAPGGLLMNFDANWYSYLYDEKARKAYLRDRENSARLGRGDYNVGENFDRMEEIARKLPLTQVGRPAWDQEVLESLGMTFDADCRSWDKVWSETEKINFASTPLFLIKA